MTVAIVVNCFANERHVQFNRTRFVEGCASKAKVVPATIELSAPHGRAIHRSEPIGKCKLKIAIVVEAIPPYCGGGEQVAWIHAVELGKRHDVTVVTFGDVNRDYIRDGVRVCSVERVRRDLGAYATTHRGLLNRLIDSINPAVIHCHMPNILSACIRKKDRVFVSTIHDGVPENEMRKLKFVRRVDWYKFRMLRWINLTKSDAVTCVSNHNLEVMRSLYPGYARKLSVIPNPIYERFFSPSEDSEQGYVLNFGRQTALKMAVLIDVAREMPTTRFVFVGTGEMVRDYGLKNVEFVGFSDAVEGYIDRAQVCVFPSRSENLPLVGLEAMARGKAVIATKRGFSEYIEHMINGYLLESASVADIKEAISAIMENDELRRRLGSNARATAERFRPGIVIAQYEGLYKSLMTSRAA